MFLNEFTFMFLRQLKRLCLFTGPFPFALVGERLSMLRRMDPRVRDLYKRLITVGRDYPTGLSHVREKAKREFFKRANLHDGLEINRAINYGRHMVREMTGIIQFKKYRALKQRYEDES